MHRHATTIALVLILFGIGMTTLFAANSWSRSAYKWKPSASEAPMTQDGIPTEIGTLNMLLSLDISTQKLLAQFIQNTDIPDDVHALAVSLVTTATTESGDVARLADAWYPGQSNATLPSHFTSIINPSDTPADQVASFIALAQEIGKKGLDISHQLNAVASHTESKAIATSIVETRNSILAAAQDMSAKYDH